ncbi:MAG: class II fructose-bisphosphate aldolase [Chloroflexi bacterium]|nr:class II fructose-bisphosphate aldolase [Chloroflexota bacterium]
MSIVSMPELLARAQQDKYAVGYFEAWDQYSLEAVLEAAEECGSPTILGFGGAVANQAWLDRHGVEELAALARCLAERSTVPAAVLFNEARTFNQIERGLRAGCNTVMLDSSHMPFDENLAWTRKVVEVAHPFEAAVEAELGHLADGSDPSVQASGTDPQEAARFVEQSGVDALAVSIGNVHILSTGEAAIDLELLERIHSAVRVPLVIHGGTGFPPSAIRAAIDHGVAKFNVGTRLKQAYLAGVHAALTTLMALPGRPNVHNVVGSRGEEDVFNQGKARIKAEVIALMRLYGSAGMANT